MAGDNREPGAEPLFLVGVFEGLGLRPDAVVQKMWESLNQLRISQSTISLATSRGKDYLSQRKQSVISKMECLLFKAHHRLIQKSSAPSRSSIRKAVYIPS